MILTAAKPRDRLRLAGPLSRPTSSREALWRARETSKPIALSGLAAGLAWLIARHLAGHALPFFAPVAAVTVVGLTVGQRATRALELVVGQALGILCADLLVMQIGTGAAQIGLVVALAMTTAVLIAPGGLLAQQAAISAVLVATVQRPGSGLAGARFIDALIGGGVALLLNTVVFPTDPLALIPRSGGPLVDEFALTLDEIADGLQTMDLATAGRALTRARSLDELREQLAGAVQASHETVSFSPRRRSSRAAVATQQVLAEQLDHAVRNTRVLARRARRAVADREEVPSHLVGAVRALSAAVRSIDLAADAPEVVVPKRSVLRAAALANTCLRSGQALSVSVLIAQVRSVVADFLLALGLEEEDALGAIDAA
jgi:uncharacterized membrane protein YgaE (UPF0421/DUF939 family)